MRLRQNNSLRCEGWGQTRSFMLIVAGFLLITTQAVSVRAQGPMQMITGLIRVPKSFGVVPMGPGLSQPAVYPCMPFTVAVYDSHALNSKPLAVSDGLMTQGPDQEEFYTCKYKVSAPVRWKLYVIPVMGGTLLLPKEDRSPMYITDAWIGGTNNKPRRGYERGFAGKYVTLGTAHGTYLRFDMYYAQVDPN